MKYLTVVIPAYNEEKRLGPTLEACKAYLSKQSYEYEIIVVDDGSSDDTSALVERYARTIPGLSLITLSTNKGKGAAVKEGFLVGSGTYRLFMDADNSTSIDQVEKLLPYFEQGYDVIISSRRIEGAKIQLRQNPFREFLGVIFRTVSHLLLPTEFKDTQNGFKLFSEKAVSGIFPTLQVSGCSFDVEVLLKAKELGLKVKEVPIVWINDGRSTIGLSHMIQMLVDLVKLRLLRNKK